MAPAGYSFAEACAMLGISAHTLRRRIRDGVIQAQRVERPQGYAWVVYLEQVPGGVTSGQPAEQTSHHPAAGNAVTSDEPANHTAHAAGSAGSHVADGQALALALAPLVEASVNAAVAPLRAELADVRTLLSTRDQELGAALERIRGLEAARSDSPEIRVGSPSANGTVEPLWAAVDVEQATPTSEAPAQRPWWLRWLPA